MYMHTCRHHSLLVHLELFAVPLKFHNIEVSMAEKGASKDNLNGHSLRVAVHLAKRLRAFWRNYRRVRPDSCYVLRANPCRVIWRISLQQRTEKYHLEGLEFNSDIAWKFARQDILQRNKSSPLNWMAIHQFRYNNESIMYCSNCTTKNINRTVNYRRFQFHF